MISSFIFALLATAGICVIFHVPLKSIPVAAIIGALTWGVYQLLYTKAELSPLFACFLSACAVGLFSDIAARICKEAATIFIIPGILCLVPGQGMYKTMAALVSDELSKATEIGTETFFTAGAIALGLLVVGSIIRIIVAIIRRASYVVNKL